MLQPRHLFTLLIPCVLFTSCNITIFKDKKLIDEKSNAISQITDSISRQESQLTVYAKTSDSLSKEKGIQETNSVLYADSAKAVMKESPIATLYIKENRQSAADVLDEYVTAHKDSLAGALLFYHVALALYGMSDSNQETIRYVESQTNRFDVQIKSCIGTISNINQQINELEANTNYCKEQIKTLTGRKEQLEQEVKALNEKGFL
jgi:DNA repair exonuclease SbcCD ATPase subunit